MVWYLKHNRDIKFLLVLLWFIIMHYLSLLRYFLSINYGPFSSWRFLIFVYLFVNFLLWLVNPCILHQKKEERKYAWLSAMFNLLHTSTNQELFEKYLCCQFLEAIMCLLPNQNCLLSAKMSGTQKRTITRIMHCIYYFDMARNDVYPRNGCLAY